jgi:hypothetical protein
VKTGHGKLLNKTIKKAGFLNWSGMTDKRDKKVRGLKS